MAEDQNYEGDIWNKETSVLLKALNWSQIGDYDMDIENDEKQRKGLDTLFEYNIFSNSKKGIILEAKSYKMSSFGSGRVLLEKWIETLYGKVNGLTSSEELAHLFPNSSNTIFKDGLIAIWFKDTENYDPVKFFELLERVRVRRSSRGIITPTRIFVLENSNLLRLISLRNHIKELCENDNVFVFHYPSGYQSNSVIQSKTISIESMFSKFILGELKDKEGRIVKKIVFYFGNPDLNNFYRLKSALSELQFLVRDTNLAVYTYQKDSNLRKIHPEIKKIFVKDLDDENRFEFYEMTKYADLPSWMTSVKY